MKQIEDEAGFRLRYNKKRVRRAFYDVVTSARKRDELVSGIYDAAQVLRSCGANNVQFCILVLSDDPANQVFCRLIEAYCCENKIPVIKVDCAATLTYIIEENPDELHHCVLVQKPTDMLEELPCTPLEILMNYIKFKETRSILKIT